MFGATYVIDASSIQRSVAATTGSSELSPRSAKIEGGNAACRSYECDVGVYDVRLFV